jgi:hypothetical protein
MVVLMHVRIAIRNSLVFRIYSQGLSLTFAKLRKRIVTAKYLKQKTARRAAICAKRAA